MQFSIAALLNFTLLAYTSDTFVPSCGYAGKRLRLQDISGTRAQPAARREARREFGFVISRSNSVMTGMRTMYEEGRKPGKRRILLRLFLHSCLPHAAQLVLIAFG